jgi:hypothetical protein
LKADAISRDFAADRFHGTSMSRMRTVSEGKLIAVLPPMSSRAASATTIKPSMARAGEAIATAVSGGQGHRASRPFSGSFTMEERNPEAAPFGRPGHFR